MSTRLATFILLGLLLLLQGQLWLGRGSLPYVWELQRKVVAQQAEHQKLQTVQTQLQSEVADLQEGLSGVEAKARKELGMLKPHEVFVRLAGK